MDQTTNNLKCKNKNVIKSRQSEASLAGDNQRTLGRTVTSSTGPVPTVPLSS